MVYTAAVHNRPFCKQIHSAVHAAVVAVVDFAVVDVAER